MSTRRPLQFVLVASLALVCAAAGCRDDKGDNDQPRDESLEARAFEEPDVVDLTDVEQFDEKTLSLSRAERFPDCEEFFEPDGEPVAHFPFGGEERAIKLAGCEPEAYRALDDGRQLVAYPSSVGSGKDLRLVSYDADGNLDWHYLLDRSRHAKHFRASFRGSFLTLLLPKLICVGTIWQDDARAACLAADTGDQRWEGRIDAWLGIGPRGLNNSLTSATDEGLTRRYPYSGVEMRFTPFDEEGGRAGFYAADSTRLFYVPAKGDAFEMAAYDLDAFEPIWRLELPERPALGFAHAFERLGLVLFLLDETLYAADADSGEIKWAAEIGSDKPPVAAANDRLFLLHRRRMDPNVLYAIEPDSGRVDWRADVPNGMLELHSVDDSLFLQSVRAVQKVEDL